MVSRRIEDSVFINFRRRKGFTMQEVITFIRKQKTRRIFLGFNTPSLQEVTAMLTRSPKFGISGEDYATNNYGQQVKVAAYSTSDAFTVRKGKVVLVETSKPKNVRLRRNIRKAMDRNVYKSRS